MRVAVHVRMYLFNSKNWRGLDNVYVLICKTLEKRVCFLVIMTIMFDASYHLCANFLHCKQMSRGGSGQRMCYMPTAAVVREVPVSTCLILSELEDMK